jgi:hypothetical protein
MIKADFARKLKEKVDAVGGGGQAKAGTRKVRHAFLFWLAPMDRRLGQCGAAHRRVACLPAHPLQPFTCLCYTRARPVSEVTEQSNVTDFDKKRPYF